MYDFEGQINFDRRGQHGWGFGHKENLIYAILLSVLVLAWAYIPA